MRITTENLERLRAIGAGFCFAVVLWWMNRQLDRPSHIYDRATGKVKRR